MLTGWNTLEVEVNFDSHPKLTTAENYEQYYKRYVSPTLEKTKRSAAS